MNTEIPPDHCLLPHIHDSKAYLKCTTSSFPKIDLPKAYNRILMADDNILKIPYHCFLNSMNFSSSFDLRNAVPTFKKFNDNVLKVSNTYMHM